MLPPKTQLQEVLYLLINSKSVTGSELYCTYHIHGYRKLLSVLRNKYGLKINRQDVSVKNIFGRTSVYGRWYLHESEKKKAKELYRKLNEK